VRHQSLMILLAHASTAIMNVSVTKNIGKSLVICTTVNKTMSKGSRRRPLAVTTTQFNRNWDRIFQNKRKQDGKNNKSNKAVEQKNNDNYARRR